jgi:prepilin-type N-terminal cleavage/methylation domain-containing protein
MIRQKIIGSRSIGERRIITPKRRRQDGFSLVEVLIAVVIMAGALVAVLGILPLSATMHMTANEKATALSLAQNQMEYFLSNPGPYPGDSGTNEEFFNANQFPPEYTGTFRANSLAAGGGLTLIVVSVKPPHSPKVELSAIDTTYANAW